MCLCAQQACLPDSLPCCSATLPWQGAKEHQQLTCVLLLPIYESWDAEGFFFPFSFVHSAFSARHAVVISDICGEWQAYC